jgi:hypothetical protein
MSIDADKLRLLEARMVRVSSPGTSREGFGLNDLNPPPRTTEKTSITVVDPNIHDIKINQLKRPVPTATAKTTTANKKQRQLEQSTSVNNMSRNYTKNATVADQTSPRRYVGPSSSTTTSNITTSSSPSNTSTIDTFFSKKSTLTPSTPVTNTSKNDTASSSSGGRTSFSGTKKRKSNSKDLKKDFKKIQPMLPPASVSASERMAQAERAKLQSKLCKLEQHVVEMTKHAKQTEEQWSSERKRLSNLVTETRQECNGRVVKAALALEEVLRQKSVQDSIQSHLALATNSHRLGRVVIQRTSTKSLEMWEDGHVFRDLEQSKKKLEIEKTQLEITRKELINKRRTLNRSQRALLSELSNDGLGKESSTSLSSSSSSSSNTTKDVTGIGADGCVTSNPSDEERERLHAFEELSLASEEEALKMAMVSYYYSLFIYCLIMFLSDIFLNIFQM